MAAAGMVPPPALRHRPGAVGEAVARRVVRRTGGTDAHSPWGVGARPPGQARDTTVRVRPTADGAVGVAGGGSAATARAPLHLARSAARAIRGAHAGAAIR